MTEQNRLVPLLVVRDAVAALDFYVRAFGAAEVAVYVNKINETISHADLAIGEVRVTCFSVTEELRAWNSDAPPSLGGSPVVLQLQVDDVDVALARALREGAEVVFPLSDFCGDRMARVRDPFGHLWILVQHIEALSHAESQKRRDELFAAFAAGPSLASVPPGGAHPMRTKTLSRNP